MLTTYIFIANHKPFVMKKKSSLLAILFAIIAFVGCKKEVEDPELYTDPSTLVSVSQFGWLQFNDAAHALSIVNQLIKEDSVYEANNDSWMGAIDTSLTQGQIDSIFAYNNYQPDYTYLSFENSHSGFVSLRQQYDYLQDVYLSNQPTTSIPDVMPDHPLNYRGLNSILNSKGECQIGNYVFFTLSDGFCFFTHADSINSTSITALRSISPSDFASISISDSITSSTTLSSFNQEYTGGDVVYKIDPDSLGVFDEGAGAIYTSKRWWRIFYQDPGDNCRYYDGQSDQYNINSQEYLEYNTVFKSTLLGHYSNAKIVHIENVNGNWKKTRAQIGVKTICPMIERDDDCDNGFILYRNIPRNCSNMYDPTCYRSSWSKKEGHTSHTSFRSNRVKIKNNTRYTAFYYNRSVFDTLYNVW